MAKKLRDIRLTADEAVGISQALELIQKATGAKNKDVNLAVKSIKDTIMAEEYVEWRDTDKAIQRMNDAEPMNDSEIAMMEDTSVSED